MSDDKDWRAPDAKPMTFDQMTARAQYEWDRAEKAEAEAQHHATALTEARAEIERLRGELADTKDDFLRRHKDAVDRFERIGQLESELSTLRARVREVVGPFAEAAADLDDTDKDSTDIWEAPCAMQITLGHLRAAHQLMEEVK